MSWLAPIGFLGLIGLVALIVIYIIKPNYQNKVISSTYIWRMSLKHRKKRIPVSKLNNILLFICQFLILTLCGLLLAGPVVAGEKVGDEKERIIVIESGAGMMLENGGETRFERAVGEARMLAMDTIENGGLVSVILADESPTFLAERAGEDNRAQLYADLTALLNENACSFGSADLDGAFALAEEVLAYNSEARVFLYTATNFLDKAGVTVRDMAHEEDWNAAILDCTAKLNKDNHYEITVNVGCYGETELVDVYCTVYDANGAGKTLTAVKSEFFDPSEEEKTLVFTTDDFGGTALYAFDYVEVYVKDVFDSFDGDNAFLLFGGKKPTIRIQYSSSIPNNFFGGIMRSLRETAKDRWNIEFVETKAGEQGATVGFDLYVYEHRMPDVIPTDGVVLLVDPTTAPEGSGLIIGDSVEVSADSTLASGLSHEIMNFVDPSRITIAKYNEIISADGYTELAFYKGAPVILVKDTPEQKVVVWAFDLNYSNIIAMPDFSFLIYNIFNHFIPSTLTSSSFEIGQTVELTGRGTNLTVEGGGITEVFEDGRGSMTVAAPGTYTVTQTPMHGGEQLIEKFYAKIPNSESDITKEVEAVPYLSVQKTVEVEYRDLLFYFAIALVALMFAEWYLQSKKNH